jgi:hypothetical protein
MESTSRKLVLALVIIAIVFGVYFMIDPTFGGVLGRRRYENFADAIVPPGAPSSAGKPATMFENGKAEAQAVHAGAHVAPSNKANKTVSPSTPAATEPKGTESGASVTEGFQTLSPSPMPFPEGDMPANCYPKQQLTPQELLPGDPNSKWAQVNPMGQGDINGKNFLNAGALIGVNTVGQSLRNANQQLRSEPPCPQLQVSIWNQTTIEPDLQRRPLEGF